VQSFDHGHLLKYVREYVNIYNALAEFTDVTEAGGSGFTQGEFFAFLTDVTSGLCFRDICRRCDYTVEPCGPYRIDEAGERLVCHYACPACDEEWTCGYARDWMRYF
jgi:hypothetical protein